MYLKSSRQHFGLSDHIHKDFKRMKIPVIEQNCRWSDFQLENRVRFLIKELCVLHQDSINRKQSVFICIFFHSVYS